LTDPTFHTADDDDGVSHLGQGKGNLGQDGIDKFLKDHSSTPLCRVLGLQSPIIEDYDLSD
jgi:hypothetical protein